METLLLFVNQSINCYKIGQLSVVCEGIDRTGNNNHKAEELGSIYQIELTSAETNSVCSRERDYLLL